MLRITVDETEDALICALPNGVGLRDDPQRITGSAFDVIEDPIGSTASISSAGSEAMKVKSIPSRTYSPLMRTIREPIVIWSSSAMLPSSISAIRITTDYSFPTFVKKCYGRFPGSL